MKAKVKATGEIVEVEKDGPFYNVIDGYERYYEHELDFQDVISYWEKLLHQYAGMAMQGMLANTSLMSMLFDATKDHDELLKEVIICSHEYAHALVEKKKKEYPKTYEECCKVLGYDDKETYCVCHTYANERLFESLYRLKVCRDAYWKIAGEEMGLGKPWKPDWVNVDQNKHCIRVDVGDIILNEGYRCQHILAFPTKEMRDAFKENFDPDIEFCKELL